MQATPAKRDPKALEREDHEARRRDAARRENEIALKVQGSFPAELAKLLIGAQVPTYELLGETIVSECREHCAQVNSINKEATAGVERLSKALADAADADDYGTVFMAIETVQINKAELSQACVKAWAQAVTLGEKIVEKLRKLPAELDEKAEAVVAEVKADLTKIGSGLESQQGWPNAAAAQHQFDFQARRLNIRSCAALAAAQNARAQSTAAVERLAASRRGLDAARNFLQRVALQATTN